MARKKPLKPAGDEKPVVRDLTFVRLTADDVIVIDLGRDFELALITVGNPISHLTRVETEETLSHSVKTRPELTETARVRLSPFAALNMSMNVLGKLIRGGQIDTEMLRTGIDEMIKQSPQDSETVESK